MEQLVHSLEKEFEQVQSEHAQSQEEYTRLCEEWKKRQMEVGA